jgi:hypothetical protein
VIVIAVTLANVGTTARAASGRNEIGRATTTPTVQVVVPDARPMAARRLSSETANEIEAVTTIAETIPPARETEIVTRIAIGIVIRIEIETATISDAAVAILIVDSIVDATAIETNGAAANLSMAADCIRRASITRRIIVTTSTA